MPGFFVCRTLNGGYLQHDFMDSMVAGDWCEWLCDTTGIRQ